MSTDFEKRVEKWDVVGRYHNDAAFHALVDMMRAPLENAMFTPGAS